MEVRNVTVINPTGLHARPASEFVKKAASFKSTVMVKNLSTGRSVNAKSIVMLLTLALTEGTEIEITTTGADEAEVADTLKAMIEGGFGEV